MTMLKQIVQLYCLLMLFNLSYAQPSEQKQFSFLNQPVLIDLPLQDHQNKDIIQQCYQELSRIEKKYSYQIAGSVVNQMNQYAGRRAVSVDKETMKLLTWGQALSEESRGSFDITSAAFLWLYGFGQKDYRVPNPLMFDRIKPVVNYELILQDTKDRVVLFKRDGVQVNINQLLIPLAFEKLDLLLKQHHVKQASIIIGQNFYAKGKKNGAQKWQHIITSTWDKPEEIISLKINQGMVLVSDIYSESFMEEGKLYHTVLDPKTGLPYQFSKMAVVYQSKLTTNAMLPIVLLTQTPERAVNLVGQANSTACLIIDSNNNRHTSRQWGKLFEK